MKGGSMFRESPFSLLADDASAACWAGRSNVLVHLRKLCHGWTNRADSSLDVVWANLGAGKTHALFHLRHLLTTELRPEQPALIAFAEVPENDGRFIEIYRRLLSGLALPELATIALSGPKGSNTNLVKAARALQYGGDSERQMAADWITAARPGLRELRALTGIDSRIETDSEAERVLSDLIGLAANCKRRVVILLDEFQRVGHLPQRAREAMLSHIRALFSRRPAHLSMVLAVGSRMEKTALELLPAELKTIMGMRKPIALPEMNAEESVEFILRRLAWYRPTDYDGSVEAPFTTDQVRLILEYMANEAQAPLKPRTILQVFGLIYDELVSGGSLDDASVRSALESMRWEQDST